MPDMKKPGPNGMKRAQGNQEQAWKWLIGVSVAVIFILILTSILGARAG